MNKYLIVNVVELAVIAVLGMLVWNTSYKQATFMTFPFISFIINALVFPPVRREILKRAKEIDMKDYLVLQDIPPNRSKGGLNTITTHMFKPETDKLIRWWHWYLAINLLTMFAVLIFTFFAQAVYY